MEYASLNVHMILKDRVAISVLLKLHSVVEREFIQIASVKYRVTNITQNNCLVFQVNDTSLLCNILCPTCLAQERSDF